MSWAAPPGAEALVEWPQHLDVVISDRYESNSATIRSLEPCCIQVHPNRGSPREGKTRQLPTGCGLQTVISLLLNHNLFNTYQKWAHLPIAHH